MSSINERVLYQALNKAYYAYKRNNWMLDFSRLWGDFSHVNIDSPIFLLGTQGGGLTLISRMLRRNKNVVSVTGDHEYWAGADEMQNVLGPLLPASLTGITHKAPPDQVFDTPRGWLYATDRLLPLYRNTKEDVSVRSREKLINILRWIINRHAPAEKDVRFTDKSQLYTIKVAFLAGLLQGCHPHFLLVIRNPYAVCYRSVTKAWSLKRLEDRFSFEERLEFAAQHWANSIYSALEDRETVNHFQIVRFEDVLRSPEENVRAICDFVNLEFRQDMLPQPEHSIPFGSRRRTRWFPLRVEVNQKYLTEIKEEHVEIIYKRCGTYAEMFGYAKP